MLHETRMVLIEKVGQRDTWFTLRYIDEEILTRQSSYYGLNVFIPKVWLNDKLVKKVLEDNGFEILDKYNEDGNIDQSYIRHEGYRKDIKIFA